MTRVEKIRAAAAAALQRAPGVISRWVSYPERYTATISTRPVSQPIPSPYTEPEASKHLEWEEGWGRK